MKNPISYIVNFIDGFSEGEARKQATKIGRRSFVSKLGQVMIGTTVLPVLPFDRFGDADAAEAKKYESDDLTEDNQSCDYWRYCALSGSLCTCCGGTINQCPPGTDVSKVSWIGTCENPNDKKSYLISYNDCCGKMSCGRCSCHNMERERPGYRLGLHNGINWCMANNRNAYHCTVAAVVGMA